MKQTIRLADVSPLEEPVEATINVPGSKSYSLRVLLISALCEGEFKIQNLLDSNDVSAMQNCLQSLKNRRLDIEAKESGLTARFMTALACISYGAQIISGAHGLQERPIKDLVDALRQLGAKIEYMDKDGYLPIKVASSELASGKVRLKGDISSQYLSALLLIAPKLKNGLVIEVNGKQISKPYIDMTIGIMSYFGIKVENNGYDHYVVKPQEYKAKDYTVEGDYSSAAYFSAINSLTNSHIKVAGLNPQSKQADRHFAEMLKDSMKPGVINMEDFPDQAMTMAVLAAFLDGKTTIEGIASLRIKETERIVALENELAKMGIKTESTDDSLTIYGGNPHGATIDTYGDHRIAMSFAVAGCKIPNLQIMHPEVVDKTFPSFWEELCKITEVKTYEKAFSNILLIGMRGSGKTTTGKILAEKLGKKFVDMDIYLEEKYGQKVRDIVLSHGWEHFRKLESEACKELSKKQDCVISSGGGIVLDEKNMELFRPDAITFLLKADPKILSKRISTDKNRPELSAQPTLIGELGEVWEDRKEKYYAHADFIIETTDISPKQTADEIMEKL